MRLIFPFIICIISVSVVGCGFLGGVEQPIAFNHNLHLDEDMGGMVCVDCHLGAETQVRATIPNIEICQVCHDDPDTDSLEEKKLVEYVLAEQKIPWKKVHRIPSHVYFSHRRHTALANIACESCHGEVSKMTVPFSKAPIPISMGSCMDCHEKNKVDNDCNRCHR